MSFGLAAGCEFTIQYFVLVGFQQREREKKRERERERERGRERESVNTQQKQTYGFCRPPVTFAECFFEKLSEASKALN